MRTVLNVTGALAVAALVCSSPSLAGTVAPGFNTTVALGPNDDGFTDAINTSFALNFFGTSYNNLFISNNGYFTFGSGQSTFTPDGLGAGYSGLPIIAAFFGDVDTRGTGTLTYGTGTFAGRAAFGATWDGVGYFSEETDKTNTFQILLTDRSDVTAGDFDIYFNYDQIEWETGGASGGINGLGGTSAAVGFNAGNGNAAGTFFEVDGSRVNGAFLNGGPNALTRITNNRTPGQLLFQVRNGGVVTPPVGGIPEPATWALMIVGFGMVGVATRRRATRVLA